MDKGASLEQPLLADTDDLKKENKNVAIFVEDEPRKVPAVAPQGNRVLILVAATISLLVLSNLSFGWTLFVDDIASDLHLTRSQAQSSFAVFSVVNSVASPFVGIIADTYSPRIPAISGGLMAGLCWIGLSYAQSLPELFLAMALGGVGSSCVYQCCVSAASKWFPDRRGMAVGIVSGGMGGGSTFSVIPISMMLRSHGWRQTLLVYGLAQGTILVLAGTMIKFPKTPLSFVASTQSATTVSKQPVRSIGVKEAVASVVFWKMFLSMILMTILGGVIVTQTKSIALDMGHTKTMVTSSLSVVDLALTLSSLANGLSRPVWGAVSDRFGRGNALAVSITLNFLFVIFWVFGIHNPFTFATGVVLFYATWGQIYALYPSLIADIFGPQFSTSIYGLLYQSKALGTVVGGPVVSAVNELSGGWNDVLMCFVGISFTAVVVQWFVLRPVIKSLHSSRL